MSEELNECRAEFETWYRREYGCLTGMRVGNGYDYAPVQRAWDGWKAAWNRRDAQSVDTTTITREWVDCPVCGEPDMRKETDKDGNALIHCVNHACQSNGGKAQALAVPEGWQLVPKEPTPEMLAAPATVVQEHAAKLICQRMLAAAPKPGDA